MRLRASTSWFIAAAAALAAALALADVFPTSPIDFTDRGNDEGNVDVQSTRVRRSPKLIGLRGPFSTTPLPAPRRFHGAIIHAGYLYSFGGMSTDVTSASGEVVSAPINSNGSLGNWTVQPVAFPPRAQHGVFAYNGYVYVVGGETTTTLHKPEVFVAKLGPNGGLSVFAPTSPLPEGRADFALAVADRRVWVLGGSSNTGDLDTILLADIRADGTLSAWRSAGALAEPRRGASAVVDGDVIFAAGGAIGGQATNEVSSARITPATGQIGNWTAVNPLPNARQDAALLALHGHLYVFGGSGLNTLWGQDVYRAPILPFGKLGDWVLAASSGGGGGGVAAATDGALVYAVGGGDQTNATAQVRWFQAGNNGEFGPWSSGTTLPAARDAAAAVAWAGRAFVFGGRSTNGRNSDGLIAPLDTTGTTLAASASTPLTGAARALSAAAVADGYVLVTGGETTDGGVVSTIDSAPLNGDGTVGSWTTTTVSPARHSHAVVAVDDVVFLLGGNDGASALDTVTGYTFSNGTLTPSSQLSGAFSPREGLSAAAQNGFVYVVGGRNGATYTNDVRYTKATPAGIVTFQAGPVLPDARAFHASFIYDGYLYVLGGLVNGTATDTGYRARIQPNGTLAGWTPMTTPLPSPRSHFSAVVINGAVHLIGGRDGADSPIASVDSAPISANGAAERWVTEAALQPSVYLAGVAATADRVFVAGGSNSSGAPVSTVSSGTLGNDGAIQGWTAMPSLPAAQEGIALFAYGGYLYAAGGSVLGRAVNRIQLAAANPAWMAAPPSQSLPDGRVYHSLAVYKNRAYVAGGQLAFNGDVLYANLGTDFPTWSIATSKLPSNFAKGCAVAYAGRLFYVGGRVGNARASTAIYAANIHSGTGDVQGGFTRVGSLPQPLKSAGCVARDGYLYVVGGDDNEGSAHSELMAAPFLSNGELGEFTSLPPLPNTVTAAATVYAGGLIHAIGGQVTATQGSSLAPAVRARLMTPQAVGSYSTLFDLSQESAVNGVRLDGTGGLHGVLREVRLGLGSGDGGYFYSTTLRDPPLNTALPINVDGGRYLFLHATLDDTAAATQDAFTARDLLDIRVDYTPPVKVRSPTSVQLTGPSEANLSATVQVQILTTADDGLGIAAPVKLTVTGGGTLVSTSLSANVQLNAATGTTASDGTATADVRLDSVQKATACAELGADRDCVDISPLIALEGLLVVDLRAPDDGVYPGGKLDAMVTLTAPPFALPSGVVLELATENLALSGEGKLAVPALAAGGSTTFDVPVEVSGPAGSTAALTATLTLSDGTKISTPVRDETAIRAFGADLGGCGCSSPAFAPFASLAALLLARSRRKR